MNIIKFGRYERDGLRLIKWIEWTIADKTNGLNFAMWTQQSWSGGKRRWRNKDNWGEYGNTNKMLEEDGYT